MYKGGLREDIETIVKVLPRPKMNGSLIVKKRNFWLIVQEYGEADGIILLNTVTNHEVPIRAQVNLGRDGKFSMEPLSDGLDSEMQVEVEDILPERFVHAEIALNKCTEEQKITIRELLIRERMTKAEVQEFCRSKGFEKGHEFFGVANQLTSFLDRDDHHAAVFSMWIKPTFVPILEKLLLDSQKHKGFSSPHSQPGTAADL